MSGKIEIATRNGKEARGLSRHRFIIVISQSSSSTVSVIIITSDIEKMKVSGKVMD